MLDMATRKKKTAGGNRKGKSLNVWIDGVLRDAVDAAVKRSRPKTGLKNLVEAALEDYLMKLTPPLWPPAP